MKYKKQDPNDSVEKACDDIRRIVMLFHSKEYTYDDYFGNDICNDCCDIEQGYRKLKTALEIIRNKNVNCNLFIAICNFKDGFQKYNELILEEDVSGKKEKNLLIQDEFDLLKEVLTWKMNQ